VSATEGVVWLPAGYVDDAGTVHDRVEVREMTGEEEDILAMPKLAASTKFTRILGNCIVRIGDIEDQKQMRKIAAKLPIGDRVVLLLALRVVSLGPVYAFEVNCPSCNDRRAYDVRLDDLDVTFMEDKTKREFALTLPSGRTATVKVMTGEDEERMVTITRTTRDALSLSIMARIKEIDGADGIKVVDVKKLSMRDRNAIRNWFQDVEGGVDTDIDLICPACGHDYQTALDIGQPSFFFPGASERPTASPTA